MAKDDKTNEETEVPAEEAGAEEKPKRSRKKAEPVAETTSHVVVVPLSVFSTTS